MDSSQLRKIVTRREALLAGLVAVSGCASQRISPLLGELAGQAALARSRPPLIVIPGAFGTRLRHGSDGREIWPRTTLALAISNFDDIGFEIDPATLDPIADDIETAGLFTNVVGRDFYRSLVAMLETTGGYTRGSTHNPVGRPEPTYYVYEYDWRHDVALNAQGLHELIERIAEAWGDSNQQVDILAHSSGGLLARYYARYGAADVLDDTAAQPDFRNSRRIRRLLLVGTPNLGTIQAVLSHARGEEVGLRHIPEEVVATCPATTQLMPHPAHDCLIDARGDALPFDQFDLESWRELSWSIFNEEAFRRTRRRLGSRRAAEAHLELLEAYLERRLIRGRRLHEALSVPARARELQPYLFGSDCTPTLSRIVVREGRLGYQIDEELRRGVQRQSSADLDPIMFDPGDGVVTRSSLMGLPPDAATRRSAPFETNGSVFLCAPHRTFLADENVQIDLLNTLLEPDNV